MRVVVALACLYAGVAISDPRPGTEVSRPAGRQPFPFWGRKKDDDDDDDSGSGSDSDDAPRFPWSSKAPQAQRPGRGRNDDDDGRGSFLAKLLKGKGGGGRRPSPWGKFNRDDDGDDDEKEKQKGRRGRDSDDGDRGSRGRGGRGGRGDDSGDESGGDSGGDSDNEQPSAKQPGSGKEPGRGKQNGKGKGPDEMTLPKGPSPKGPGKQPQTPGGRGGPPLQQAGPAPSPPKAGGDSYNGMPRAPKLPGTAPSENNAPPAAKPDGQAGKSSPLPSGSSPPERYARLAGSPGNGIWRQAPTPGGNCPMGIYHPKPYTTFQYLLNSRIDVRTPLLTGIEVYILDMFETTKEDITKMHQQGRKVICYFNAGGSQEGNPDNDRFQNIGVKGGGISKENGQYWPGENWVDTGRKEVRQIMFDRIKKGREKGCLGFEFDNVDAYENKDNGLKGGSMTLPKAAEYVKALCAEAHRNCMSCNLKNSPEMVPLVNSTVQYYVNEECVKYKHCNVYDKVGLSKPIFHIEYTTAKLTGPISQIVPGSNLQPGEDGDNDDDDDDDRKKRKNVAGGKGGQRGGAPKWGSGQSGAPRWGSGQSGVAKVGGGQSGRPKSGGLFSSFFGKMMRGKERRLSKRAEQADLAQTAGEVELAEPVGRVAQVDKLDGGNKGEHANGQAWYCPKINGMSSILGHEGLEGEIQTCGGIVHKSRVRG